MSERGENKGEKCFDSDRKRGKEERGRRGKMCKEEREIYEAARKKE